MKTGHSGTNYGNGSSKGSTPPDSAPYAQPVGHQPRYTTASEKTMETVPLDDGRGNTIEVRIR